MMHYMRCSQNRNFVTGTVQPVIQEIEQDDRLPDGVIDAGGTDQQFFVQSGFLDFAKEVPRLVDASLDIVRYAPALR